MELLPRRPDRLFPVLLRWMAIGMLSLFAHRLVFLFMYAFQAVRLEPELHDRAVARILKALFAGLRFDLATLTIWIGPFALLLSLTAALYALPAVRMRYRLLNRLFFFAQWIYLLWLHLVSVASTYNFSVNGKHLGWEFAAYFRDLPALLAGSFVKDPVPTTMLALFIPAWLGAGFFIDRRLNAGAANGHHNPDRKARLTALFSPLIVVITAIVFFRGGLQQNPLRPGDAMSESSPFLNNLKITGTYLIVHDLSDRSDFKTFYPADENIVFVQRMLNDGRPYIDPRYPLLRRMEVRRCVPGRFATIAEPGVNARPARQPNFVVLLMESWSAKFLESHGYSAEVAPNFNRLAHQGVLFENFYASGGRSANGLFSILTGIPDRAGRTILRSSRIFNRFGSLPHLLKKKGYQTLFVHGGDLHFDNLDTGLPHLGFDHLAGMKEMEDSGLYSRRWTMGFHDEDMYDMLLRKVDELYAGTPDRPFFAMAFTSNNHHPFGLPDPSFAIFPESDPEAAFKNSYHYSDYALGKLIDTIRTKPYFRSTIILIVADHSHHANLDYLQDREIPLLVYAPYFFRPERRTDIAGQLDLLPTILSLSGGDSPYAAMGRDLTVPAKRPFAFFAGGSNTDIIGMIRDGFIYYHYLRSSQSILLKATRPVDMRDMQAEQPQLAVELDAMTKHYYQFARSLEKENRIWPESISE